MKKFIASSNFSALLLTAFGTFGILMSSAYADSGNFNISGNKTSSQSLSNGQTGTVTNTGTLSVASGTAIAVAGTSTSPSNQITITNSGSIKAGTGRAVRDQSGGSKLLLTNNAGALIQASGNDVIAINVNGSATSSASVIDVENYGTIQSLDAGGSGTTTPTAKGNQPLNLTVTTGSNIVNNYSTGVIWATAADAVRPGTNGVVHNDGLIFSNAYQGSSSDGIDGQTASGITIVNGYTTTTPGGTIATYQGAVTGYVGNASDVAGKTQSTIEGGRHGITGGNTGTTGGTTQLEGYTGTGVYTMTITNNQGATIQGDNGSGINIDGFGIQGTQIQGTSNYRLVTNESVTVTNYGTIVGNGVTGDGDGVDIDGDVNITNAGTILSRNSFGAEFSEGITVGGGTITNQAGGTIEGSVASGNTTAVGRGITLAGIDKDANDNAAPIESIYENSTITNSGLIKGDSESGIAVLGTTGGGYTVTITNNATGTIEGNNSGVSENGTIATGPYAGQMTGQSQNQAAIELDDTGNTYVINNYGTIKQDNSSGTAIAMNGVSNTLNVLGGSASIIGNISGSSSGTSTSTLNIDPNAGGGSGQSFTYAGAISNFNNVNILSGKVILSGNNSYTGATHVQGGNLQVDGYISHSATTVSSGATLSGTGTLGDVTMNSGSTLMAGDSTTAISKTLSTGNLLLNSGATFQFKLDTSLVQSDTISVTGNLTLDNANLVLNDLASSSNSLTIGTVFTLFTYTGTENGELDYNGTAVADGGTITYGNNTFKIKYSDGDPSVTLTVQAVPEPNIWALLIAGLGVLTWMQRTRRQKNENAS